LLAQACDSVKGARVLVTGATGFVGANLVRTLLAQGADTHLLIRDAGRVRRLAGILPRATSHTGDLEDFDSLARAFQIARPEIVFHLATPRGADAEARLRIVRTTLLGAAHLIRLAREFGIRKLIVAGSSLEYGTGSEPLRECAPLLPATWHGATKAAATVLYRQAAVEFALPVVILRLFHVFGPLESSHRLVPTAIRAAYSGRPLLLTVPGIRRDWILVDDVVEAMLHAVVRGDPGTVFNIGSGVEYANEEVAARVEQVTGRPLAMVLGAYGRRPTDAEHRCADRTRAAQELYWEPRHDLTAGIRRTVEWYKVHPDAWSAPDDIAPVVV
jgi:nucleoside-diphosphate-sugar epimerase